MPPPPADLEEIGAEIDWPDHEAAAAVSDALARRAGLGRLGELAEWVAGLRGAGTPDFARVRLVRFGPQRPGSLDDRAGVAGCGVRDAGTHDAVPDAVRAGVALADDEIEQGADLLLATCAGDGLAELVVIAALTGTEPVRVLARGAAATDPRAWMARAAAVRDARRRIAALRYEPTALLAELGSAALAATCGFVLRAAARRTPVVLDGLPALAAALIGYEAQSRAPRWWQVADRLADPAADLAVDRLARPPVLDLGIGGDDGRAGLLAAAVLREAAALAAEAPAPRPAPGLDAGEIT